MAKHRIEPSIPRFGEGLATLSGTSIDIAETENLVFAELWLGNNHTKLTDEELTELRDICTRALRTRRRRK